MTAVSSIGIVKQVLSGDTIVIRDRPVDGPPPERTVQLSFISCGRLARKPSPNNPNPPPEDPYAWKAREFVRSKLVGKEVYYTIETAGKRFGTVIIGRNPAGENIAVTLLEEGLAELRKVNFAVAEKNVAYKQLLTAEERGKTLGKGRWSSDTTESAIRNVVWNIEDPHEFISEHKNEKLNAIIEYVRDGSSFQLTLLPTSPEKPVFHNIIVSISGIKAPSIRMEDGQQIAEPYGLDAHFFVESRLLQREVVVILESCINQNFIGSILHPKGNIAELLLREGLAKCVMWNMNSISIPGAIEAYKAAEQSAKDGRLRLWQSYHPTADHTQTTHVQVTDKMSPGRSFLGTIAEVGNGDNISVKCNDGVVRKFFLSSIRSPKPAAVNNEERENTAPRNRIRPLYDVPYVFEAREHLRLYVGKPVSVLIDYVQPKMQNTLNDRICATVQCDNVNLAESLVANGLATVIRYRNSNDARSSSYPELLAAEQQAQNDAIGLHSKQSPPVHRVSDLMGNVAKSRQFLPFLKRTPRFDGVVEFVVHAGRLRVYLPRESCLITFLLSGIQCPRRGRTKPDGTEEQDMPFSVEAMEFVRSLCMQRNVELSVDTMDRAGNFVGWMFIGKQSEETVAPKSGKSMGGKKKRKATETSGQKMESNLNVLLVSTGLATILRSPTTESSPYYHDLVKAEESAKEAKLGLWSSEDFIKQWEAESAYLEDQAAEAEDDGIPVQGKNTGYVDDLSALNLNGPTAEEGDQQKLQWKSAQITAIPAIAPGTQSLRFFAQHSSDSVTIMHITQNLNVQHPPPVPNYQPKKNELCAACYSVDNHWYRARVVRKNPKSLTVNFIDFGNEETIQVADVSTRLSPLPPALMNIPPQAHEYRLAFIQLPPDSEDRTFAIKKFAECVGDCTEVLVAAQFDAIPCARESVKAVPAVAIKSMRGGLSNSNVDPWVDVGKSLLEEGYVCVEPMRPDIIKQASHSLLQDCLKAQESAKKGRKNLWLYGDFRVDDNQ